jgi:anthranilate/para-aminobenzoate synthase component I
MEPGWSFSDRKARYNLRGLLRPETAIPELEEADVPDVPDPISLHSETVEVPYQDPFSAFLALRARWGEGNVFLLESLSGPARDVRSSLIGFGPLLTVELQGSQLRLGGRPRLLQALGPLLDRAGFRPDADGKLDLGDEGQIWAALRAIQSSFRLPARNGASFQFGFFGYFGYDIARTIERLPMLIPGAGQAPTLAMAIYQAVLEYDCRDRRAKLVSNSAGQLWEPQPAAGIREILAGAAPPPSDAAPPVPRPRGVRGTMKRDQYLEKVDRALQHIRRGDIYQVQIGHEILVETDADPLAVYQRMRHRNPSPYMYMASFGETTLLGASPESFIKIEDGQISMRPIAGTVRRGQTVEEDATLVDRLLHDEKELAEHIMLVDLCRNDIGRVCQQDTLVADELLVVEQYSHVNHLVSNVSGRLRPELDAFDAIAATFPAGTMTGAPKVRAMQIIEELEHTRRGAYAGAIGLIDFAGPVNMALCIRSAVYRPGQYVLRASAGTVADSSAAQEWAETLHKMGAVYWSVAGQELNETLYESFEQEKTP